jgi:hypothetical protein
MSDTVNFPINSFAKVYNNQVRHGIETGIVGHDVNVLVA